MQVVNWPLDKAGDLLMKTPGVGWVIEKSVGGLVTVVNDGAQWSVRHEAIKTHDDLLALDLKQVDKTIGLLAVKYKGLALTEGAAFGALGLPGIPPDIVAVIGLNLRAIGEYATYCGFDVSLQQEKLFAMNLRGLASSPNDASKAPELLPPHAHRPRGRRHRRDLPTFVAASCRSRRH